MGVAAAANSRMVIWETPATGGKRAIGAGAADPGNGAPRGARRMVARAGTGAQTQAWTSMFEQEIYS
ncbi:MAG TPA: hypothetical protein DCW29_10560 [Janthinobacterium sp.]|nr:hypothetical protein [Janthinobacterium sp.]